MPCVAMTWAISGHDLCHADGGVAASDKQCAGLHLS